VPQGNDRLFERECPGISAREELEQLLEGSVSSALFLFSSVRSLMRSLSANTTLEQSSLFRVSRISFESISGGAHLLVAAEREVAPRDDSSSHPYLPPDTMGAAK
jgi:hypothetical protein